MSDDSRSSPDSPVPLCGHDNPPTANFCDVCGARLALRCPGCRSINRSQANFCNSCGTSLEGLRPAQVSPGPAEHSLDTRSETPDFSEPLSPAHARGDDASSSEAADAARLEDVKRFLRRHEGRTATASSSVSLASFSSWRLSHRSPLRHHRRVPPTRRRASSSPASRRLFSPSTAARLRPRGRRTRQGASIIARAHQVQRRRRQDQPPLRYSLVSAAS